MALPNSYSVKAGSFQAYFQAIQEAQAPERFTVKFLEGLEFASTNDRTFIGILKELGFLDANNAPTKRYYEFLDKDVAAGVLADGIKEMFSDLFAIRKDAQKMTQTEVYNKLRTLYAGKGKTDNLIKLIATNFVSLCKLADFEKSRMEKSETDGEYKLSDEKANQKEHLEESNRTEKNKKINIDGLQYHINIILPDTKDQAVYDAIFKSLRDHLG
ncbi:MAG: DUF5343 domain-containing protein [Chitinophagaceae bacterium]|nr:DUF5343 domain-containing protein [Chitinophagaceae bacterium]